MNEPIQHPAVAPDASHDEAAALRDGAGVTLEAPRLRTRVVREARRETWFVINDGVADITTIPIELRADAALRRVEVNGEASEFTTSGDEVLVQPRRPLRPGAGTIVILHFR